MSKICILFCSCQSLKLIHCEFVDNCRTFILLQLSNFRVGVNDFCRLYLVSMDHLFSQLLSYFTFYHFRSDSNVFISRERNCENDKP